MEKIRNENKNKRIMVRVLKVSNIRRFGSEMNKFIKVKGITKDFDENFMQTLFRRLKLTSSRYRNVKY